MTLLQTGTPNTGGADGVRTFSPPRTNVSLSQKWYKLGTKPTVQFLMTNDNALLTWAWSVT